ncbi:unnamed protein product, partial [Brenthis ino]
MIDALSTRPSISLQSALGARSAMASDARTPSSTAARTPSPPTSPRPATPNLTIEKAFILEFEKLPILWDKKHTHYTNKYKRMEALKQLLEILKRRTPEATVFEVKRKINTIRTNYRRELRKIIAYQKAGNVHVPKGWAFKYLHFLNKDNEIVSELNQTQDTSINSDCVERKPNVTAESPIYLRPRAYSSSDCDIPDPIELTSIKHRESEDRSNEMLHEPCMFSTSQPTRSNATAIYWTEKLERLSNTQRIFAEKAINEVLFEAELGNLNKHSVKINEGM